MFNWLKTLFSSEQQHLHTIPEKEPNTYSSFKDPKPKEEVVEKSIVDKEKQSHTSQTTEPKKRGRKKAGITKTDLNKMTKDELEAYAKKELKVDLDKRRKKADLVEEVLKLAK